MAEKWAHIKAEVIAGAQTFDSESQAFEEAQAKAIADGEPRMLVRVVADIKRDPKPPVIVTRFE